MSQIFQLKLKGDTTITTATSVEFRIRGERHIVNNNNQIERILNSSNVLPEDIQVLIKNKYYPINNIYLKLYDEYLIEGNIIKGDE